MQFLVLLDDQRRRATIVDGAGERIAAPAILSATRIRSALAERAWALSHRTEPVGHVFVLDSGTARLDGGAGGDASLAAPAVIWLPTGEHGTFRVAAGGEGYHLAATEGLLWRIIGEGAAGANLQQIMARPILATGLDEAAFAQIWVAAEGLCAEAEEQRAGSVAMIGFQLGTILLQLWRVDGSAGSEGVPSGSLVLRFRHLIELHFRDQLGIDRYAALLGVTRGRLRDACLRAENRTPLALVHGRIIEEAQRRLEQTEMSVEQVAYSLGFRDAPYFSRFFARLCGTTPGAFRKAAAKAGKQAGSASFAAWP
jgi:AraC family transcriptional activator of pobA